MNTQLILFPQNYTGYSASVNSVTNNYVANTSFTSNLLNQGSVELKEALQRDPSVVIDENARGEHEISIRGSNANEVLII